MTVAVCMSSKMYFGHRQAEEWFDRVAEVARAKDAMGSGEVGFSADQIDDLEAVLCDAAASARSRGALA